VGALVGEMREAMRECGAPFVARGNWARENAVDGSSEKVVEALFRRFEKMLPKYLT